MGVGFAVNVSAGKGEAVGRGSGVAVAEVQATENANNATATNIALRGWTVNLENVAMAGSKNLISSFWQRRSLLILVTSLPIRQMPTPLFPLGTLTGRHDSP